VISNRWLVVQNVNLGSAGDGCNDAPVEGCQKLELKIVWSEGFPEIFFDLGDDSGAEVDGLRMVYTCLQMIESFTLLTEMTMLRNPLLEPRHMASGG